MKNLMIQTGPGLDQSGISPGLIQVLSRSDLSSEPGFRVKTDLQSNGYDFYRAYQRDLKEKSKMRTSVSSEVTGQRSEVI